MHEFYFRFASCLPCRQLSYKRRSTRTCWMELSTLTRPRWNPHRLKKRIHFQIQKVGGMEVDLNPASYGRYTVCLAMKFSSQPQSSHWAKVVHGSNLSQYHFKPGLWQCIKITTKHIWTSCFSLYTYIVKFYFILVVRLHYYSGK